MPQLAYAERPAYEQADGLLILHHGYGSDENSLLELANVIDRSHRMHVVMPRAPLPLPAGSDGHRWFEAPRIGEPDPDSFAAGYGQLCEFHDAIWEATGIPASRTVLCGFSMGTEMAYATGLGAARPRPAGIIALSGLMPAVSGWGPDLAERAGLPVLIAHGRTDQSVGVEHAHRARDLLTAAGLEVTYHETGGGHEVDPTAMGKAIQWLGTVI